MNKSCILVCMLLLASFAGASKVYELHLIIYKNDSVTLISINETQGKPGPFPSAGDDNYLFRMLSDDGTVLFNQSFQMDFFAYRFRGPNSTLPDVVALTQREGYWKLPYYENASIIALYHEEKKIFEYDLKPKKEEWQIPCCPSAVAIIFAVLVCVTSIKSGARLRFQDERTE